MKIALLIRGLTYIPRGYIHHTGKVFKINYKNNIQNIFDKVIIPLKENYEVDLYITSNISEFQQQVLDDFAPVTDSIFLDEQITQGESLIQGLKLIKNKNKDYDFVIITRFDLALKKNITDISFKWDKFNFLWYEQTKDERIGDCMFFLNYKFLNSFIESLIECPRKKCIHYIKSYILKYIYIDELNFIYDGFIDSNSDKQENPIYIINRGKIIRDLSTSFYNKFLKGNKLKLMGLNS